MNLELKAMHDEIHPLVGDICNPIVESTIEEMFDSRLEACGGIDGTIIGSSDNWDECWTRTWNEMFILMTEVFRGKYE